MKYILRTAMALAVIAAGAFCADNTLGTWKLNPDKSKPPVGQSRITSLTVVRETSAGGVKVTATGEREHKSKIDVSYTAKYDGKDVTVSGSGLPYDTLAIKQVDANTLTDVRSRTAASTRLASGLSKTAAGPRPLPPKGQELTVKDLVV